MHVSLAHARTTWFETPAVLSATAHHAKGMRVRCWWLSAAGDGILMLSVRVQVANASLLTSDDISPTALWVARLMVISCGAVI